MIFISIIKYFCIFSEYNSVGDAEKDALLCCKSRCPKIMDCGHCCPKLCHSGDCGKPSACIEKKKVRCKCGRRKKVSKVPGFFKLRLFKRKIEKSNF